VFAEALDDATVAVMSLPDFEALMRDEPGVALRVMQAIGRQLISSQGVSSQYPRMSSGTLQSIATWKEVGIPRYSPTSDELKENP